MEVIAIQKSAYNAMRKVLKELLEMTIWAEWNNLFVVMFPYRKKLSFFKSTLRILYIFLTGN